MFTYIYMYVCQCIDIYHDTYITNIVWLVLFFSFVCACLFRLHSCFFFCARIQYFYILVDKHNMVSIDRTYTYTVLHMCVHAHTCVLQIISCIYLRLYLYTKCFYIHAFFCLVFFVVWTCTRANIYLFSFFLLFVHKMVDIDIDRIMLHCIYMYMCVHARTVSRVHMYYNITI